MDILHFSHLFLFLGLVTLYWSAVFVSKMDVVAYIILRGSSMLAFLAFQFLSLLADVMENGITTDSQIIFFVFFLSDIAYFYLFITDIKNILEDNWKLDVKYKFDRLRDDLDDEINMRRGLEDDFNKFCKNGRKKERTKPDK